MNGIICRTGLIAAMILALAGGCQSQGDTGSDDASDFSGIEYECILNKNTITAYSDGSLALIKRMTQELRGDGSASSELAALSLGADMLTLDDSSFISVSDASGRQMASGFDRTITFKLNEIPLGILKDDMVRMTEDGMPFVDSQMIILLPDSIDLEDLNEINRLLSSGMGGARTSIKAVRADADLSSLKNELNLGNKIDFSDLFGDLNIWGSFTGQDFTMEEDRNRYYYDSMGGITCEWGYEGQETISII